MREVCGALRFEVPEGLRALFHFSGKGSGLNFGFHSRLQASNHCWIYAMHIDSVECASA